MSKLTEKSGRFAALMAAIAIALPAGLIGLAGLATQIGVDAIAQTHDDKSHDSHKGKGGPGKSHGGGRDTKAPHGKSEDDKIFRGKKHKGTEEESDHGADRSNSSPSDKHETATTETDSDRRGPKYKGGRDTGKPTNAAVKKGSIYADLWVILRNPNGTPILSAQGFVQPVDRNGVPIPLNTDGSPVDPASVVEVELSRLNVARAPKTVLDRQLADVVKSINGATAITQDTAGRIVVTIGTTTKTIDSPLANLAIYKALIEKGYIPGVNTSINLGTLSFLNDGVQTNADFSAAARFLGAASDKSGRILPDTVAYLNQIIQMSGPSTFTFADNKVYVAVPADLAYTRAAYNVAVEVLVKQTDGSYVRRSVNLIDAVFAGVTFAAQPLTGFGALTQAADDARAVIQFLHDNPLPTN